MDIELGKGIVVGVNPAEQSNEWLITSAQEIAEVAEARGLELAFAAGTVAVASAEQSEPAKEAAENTETLDVREQIISQLPTAYEGYATVLDRFNVSCKKKDRVPIERNMPENELESWLTDDKLAYVTEAMEADPELQFTLVATPNILASPSDIQSIAKAFGTAQPYETYVDKEMYDMYSAEELSGTPGGGPLRFSLIPSKYDESLTTDVKTQQAMLKDKQAKNPELNLQVPSVLDALSYWHTLRAGGDKLADNSAFYKTYIRHFNLDSKQLGYWSPVPYSYVGDGGRPLLYRSAAGSGRGARLSVG